ncbi:MAG: TonB-dependent receptor [Pseudomonadota bacterium]
MRQSNIRIAAALLASATTLVAPHGWAQDDGALVLDEIVVTARKKAESIQDIPISVAAVDGDYISKQQFVNAIELARDIPNVQIKSGFSASNPTLFIRGVGINDTSPATSGAIGVTLDEVFLNSSVGQLFQMYDLDRVEVLKGPQGTLYGRNTTGGVLNFYTKRPGFEYDPSLRLTYGRFDEINLEAASSIPIIDNVLAGRVSISVRDRDGVRTNLETGTDTNRVEATAIRGQLLYTPTEQLQIHAKAEAGFNRGDFFTTKGFGTLDPVTGVRCTDEQILAAQCVNALGYSDSEDPFEARYNIDDQKEDLDNYAARLGVEWADGSWSLSSISSFVSNERDIVQDIDSSPLRLLEQTDSFALSQQWSQELRVAHDDGGRLDWILGAFYLTESLKSDQTYELLGVVPDSIGAPLLDFESFVLTARSRYKQNTESFALFGQATYDLTDRLSATLGGRFTWEDKSIIQGSLFAPTPVDSGTPRIALDAVCCIVGDISSVDPATGLPTRLNDQSLDFSEPSWRLSLDYDFTPDMLGYASYARGVRAGGFNAGALLDPLSFNTVEPEEIDTFEVGLKSDLLDGRVRFNAAAFYNTGQLQVNTLIATGVPVSILDSADIESYGIEWETQARVTESLTARFAGALFEGEFTEYPGTPANVGNELPNAPDVSLSGSLDYTVPISDRWDLNLFTDANYQSKVFFQPSNAEIQSRDGVAVWNARVAFQKPRSGLEIGAYVRNITDEIYLIDIFDVEDFGFYQANFSYPRTYGVSFGWTY